MRKFRYKIVIMTIETDRFSQETPFENLPFLGIREPATGQNKEQLEKSIDEILQKGEFTGSDLMQFSRSMLDLLGGRRISAGWGILLSETFTFDQEKNQKGLVSIIPQKDNDRNLISDTARLEIVESDLPNVDAMDTDEVRENEYIFEYKVDYGFASGDNEGVTPTASYSNYCDTENFPFFSPITNQPEMTYKYVNPLESDISWPATQEFCKRFFAAYKSADQSPAL